MNFPEITKLGVDFCALFIQKGVLKCELDNGTVPDNIEPRKNAFFSIVSRTNISSFELYRDFNEAQENIESVKNTDFSDKPIQILIPTENINFQNAFKPLLKKIFADD